MIIQMYINVDHFYNVQSEFTAHDMDTTRDETICVTDNIPTENIFLTQLQNKWRKFISGNLCGLLPFV